MEGTHVLEKHHTSECSNILSSKPTAVELFEAESRDPVSSKQKNCIRKSSLSLRTNFSGHFTKTQYQYTLLETHHVINIQRTLIKDGKNTTDSLDLSLSSFI